jgi:hypothetical protein
LSQPVELFGLLVPGECVGEVVHAGPGVAVDVEDHVDVGFFRAPQPQSGGLQLLGRVAPFTHAGT